MSFVRPEHPKPITARPSKWVWSIVAWFLLAIALAVTVFPANTQGFMFGSPKIKSNYGKTLMKEMFVAAGIKEEWLDQDGAFAHEE